MSRQTLHNTVAKKYQNYLKQNEKIAKIFFSLFYLKEKSLNKS